MLILKCNICDKSFDFYHTHHIDGNRNNNLVENLLNLCQRCHHQIHRGIRNKKISSPLKELKRILDRDKLIKYYRIIWLNNKVEVPLHV